MTQKIVWGLMLLTIFVSCASTKAYKELNESPQDVTRGDPINNTLAKDYLEAVLQSPDGREVKAYSRRAFAPTNKKNFFVFHMFYAYLKDNELEHTLVFTATPDGSEYNGCWMLDAPTDIESYQLFSETSENIWDVEEYKGPKGETILSLTETTKQILARMDKKYTFFGPASVRNYPWYHYIWATLVPPPFSPQILMLLSINKDNCTSAVMETMKWQNETPFASQ